MKDENPILKTFVELNEAAMSVKYELDGVMDVETSMQKFMELTE